jgi:NTP pyrophosphatase (non-canonical NTP hydrolase)
MASKLHLKAQPTVADLQKYVVEMVAERGFRDDVSQRFMLLFEEVGEFAKAARKHVGLGYANDVHDQNLEGEAADVFIILLGLCNLLDIDLEQAFRDKEAINKKRQWK